MLIIWLEKSPRAWFGSFSKALRHQGYKQSNADHTMFFKHNGQLSTFLIFYVDDIVVTGNNVAEIRRLKQALGSEFKIKDLGQLRFFLGTEVGHSSTGVFFFQRKYTFELLSKIGLLGSKPVDTPLDANVKNRAKEGEPVD